MSSPDFPVTLFVFSLLDLINECKKRKREIKSQVVSFLNLRFPEILVSWRVCRALLLLAGEASVKHQW